MMKVKKIYWLSILIIIIFLSSTPAVLSAPSAKFMQSLNTTAVGTGHADTAFKKPPIEVVGIVIKTILSFLGVIFLILMIYGGYIWMMARGNEQEVERAKNIIKDAIIGLIIVLLAYAITALVGGELKNAFSAE